MWPEADACPCCGARRRNELLPTGPAAQMLSRSLASVSAPPWGGQLWFSDGHSGRGWSRQVGSGQYGRSPSPTPGPYPPIPSVSEIRQSLWWDLRSFCPWRRTAPRHPSSSWGFSSPDRVPQALPSPRPPAPSSPPSQDPWGIGVKNPGASCAVSPLQGQGAEPRGGAPPAESSSWGSREGLRGPSQHGRGKL